jgi:hypothetical protein
MVARKSVVSYWKKGEAVQNFGDYISEYLATHLFYPYRSGVRAVHVMGSVIDGLFVPMADDRPVVFWGCGLRCDQPLDQEVRQRTEIAAVRGPLSASALGLGSLVPMGDPAFLLPAFHTPAHVEKLAGKAVCIPHFNDQRADEALLTISGCDAVLRPSIDDSEVALLDLINAITSADFVLSASLHGCIVAAAYQKPFSYWDTGTIDLPFKWQDLSASISVPCEFAKNVKEGRRLYRERFAPRIKLPDLTESLLKAPLLLRASGLIQVLTWQTSQNDISGGKVVEYYEGVRELARRQQAIYDGIVDEGDYWFSRFQDAERRLTDQAERHGYLAERLGQLEVDAATRLETAARHAEERQLSAQTELAAAAIERERFRDEIAHAKRSLQTTSDELRRIQDAEVQLRQVKRDLAATDAELVDYKERLARTRQEQTAASDLAGQLQHDLRVAQTELLRLGGLAGELKSCQGELAALAASAETTLAALADANAERAHLKARLETVADEKAEASDQVRRTQQELDLAQAELLRLSDIEDEQESFSIELAALESERANILSALAAALQKRDVLEDALEQSRTDSSSLAADLEQSREEMAWLQFRLEAEVQQSAQQNAELEVLRSLSQSQPEVQDTAIVPEPANNGTHMYDDWMRQVHIELLDNPWWWGLMPQAWQRDRLNERLRRRGLFDGQAYLDRYPDVAAVGMDPLRHYLLHGLAEGRQADTSRAHEQARSSSMVPLAPVAAKVPIEYHVEYPEIPLNYHRKKRIMIIDGTYPTPERDSGSVDAVNFIKIFNGLGYEVYYMATANFVRRELDQVAASARVNLEAMGVLIIDDAYAPNVAEIVRMKGGYFDIFFLSRIYAGGVFFEDIRTHAPESRVIFNTVDLHGVREMREGQLEGDRLKIMAAYGTMEREHYLARLADATIVVSSEEARLLAQRVPGANVFEIPLLRDVPGSSSGLDKRSNIGFIGGYKHSPNIDAVTYFLDSIWPLVLRELPDARFHLMGADMPDEIRNRTDAGLVVVGHVPDLQVAFDGLRMTVAPLRVGAGAKGKVVSSLCHGLPCVVTPIAVEGMGVETGVLVAHSPEQFAAEIVRLYSDDDLWCTLSKQGLALMERRYSLKAGVDLVQTLFKSVTADVSGLGAV